MLRSVFRLKVQQVHQTCLFELSWGRGKQISATLPYPELLFKLYREWQRAYLNFYKTALRARVAETGKINPSPEDWHRQLVQAEAKLLFEFHRWLRREELYELRGEIARTAQNLAERGATEPKPSGYYIDIFLTCNSSSLERLPWETWEIGTEFGATATIRLTRTPVNIRSETASHSQKIRPSRVRILAILGDDTGLNFQGDRQALRSLEKIAEIELVGWQPGQITAEIKTPIQEALIDERGWDVLFFAGHSNETVMTGGELAIAPGVSISVKEIAPQLQIAKAKGLQFALFNSCSGLSLANSLIDLGLSQVAVMREPIHNQVAQVFLVWFLQGLAEYKDVHDALMAACEHLKQKQNLTYPCAYLIPSLFSHPHAPLFRIEPWGWKHTLKRWLPTRIEAIALSVVTVLSLISPMENFLLEGRILVQSIYRDITNQIPLGTKPPVLLVQIDERSITEAGISDPHPMNRSYLASIVAQLTTLDAQVIGVDYLLDRASPERDSVLAESVRAAVAEKGIWFIFAAILNPAGTEIGVEAKTGIAQPNWSLQGYTNALPQYVRLPASTDCSQTCPFAYLLAMVGALHQQPFASDLPQPQLNNQGNFRTQLFDFVNSRNNHDDTVIFLRQARFHPLTNLSQNFGQFWLRPIIDFSLPPDLAYDHLPAWQLLNSTDELKNYRFDQQIAIIAPGGYDEAGVTLGADNFPIPLAVAYWRARLGLTTISSGKFTGSEVHGYTIHHLLRKRLVIPIPNLWAIALAGLLGKGVTVTLLLEKHHRQRQRLGLSLTGATAIYGLVALQVYVTAAVLLPWLLPSTTFLVYVWFFSRNKYYE